MAGRPCENEQVPDEVAVSTVVGGVKYLLTQNCRHIANATVLPSIYDLLEDLGFARLLICTPAEFLGDPDNGS